MYDDAGAAYIDVHDNVACLGHSHPAVVEAVNRQWATLNTPTRSLHEAILDYAERLVATFPAPLSQAMFTCTGPETNGVAYRIAEHHTGGTGGIATALVYRGVSDAASQFSPLLGDGVLRGPQRRLVARIVNDLRRKRVLISASGPHGNVLKIRFPLVFSERDATLFLERLGDVLTQARGVDGRFSPSNHRDNSTMAFRCDIPASPTLQLDDAVARITRWDFAPGAVTGWHEHGWPYFVTMLVAGTLRIHDGERTTDVPLEAGQSYRRPAGIKHDVMNASAHPIAFVEIEIKQALGAEP